ncbi:2',3'-cyclic-nucleotide 2'-phosphodiesterase/5'-or 3'-nucleotidase, 5'-nucleotidase family [Halomicrobium zhouii]|uniref:2',3'-cyclic-nucleotide 2'-phosphodiesterase/5'-or 3'-nucleotidase, 5'-nucleotidase family n=1 Tax=Halomicrobium zhouii TaxID=767519 RepID=A0A1I6LRN4_9EURY|nr:bifunctional metallophosphatase/5'-nucleotidase [Halomicrobium zhouii]SFS06116.1 2',3'-cyclic-nucleotide 2'-phosphodiesterase/5'-or 3'-nucleotidase, 5'-nucleotidase family [Halomicrobium zhouii]
MPPSLVHYSDVENAYDDPGNAGRLAGTIDALRGDATVVCGTGDNTAPGVLSMVTEGRQSLPFYDAVGPDFETFGNHDFDHGVDAIREIVADSPQTWLTANVVDGDGTRFLADETAPWALQAVDGTTVGFVGVTDPKTTAYVPETGSLEFLDPTVPVQQAAEALRERGAEWVVVLSHLGRLDETLAAETDVDVILGGHVHSEIVERLDETLLTRPGVNGEIVYEIDLGESPTVTRHEVEDGPRHDGVAETMAELREEADLDEVVDHVSDPILRTESTAFRGESRIGNFVADAYRWAAEADVGLQNSGGIREGPPLAGDVTVADLVSVVPFDEPVAVAELTGTELRTVIRQCSGANISFGESDWWNGHLSGLSVVWDRSDGEISSLNVDGSPVEDDATYSVATADFLFHTSEEFPVLDETHRTGTLDTQFRVMAEYARAQGIDPEVEDRIVYR